MPIDDEDKQPAAGHSDVQPTITAQQLKRLHALSTQIFHNDRDGRIDFASLILHRDIESYKDLTEQEAAKLADILLGYQLLDSYLSAP